MNRPVICIGLDACDPVLIEKWMAQGHLKNLNKIRNQGVYGRLTNTVQYHSGSAEFSSTEPLWVMFSTGCVPNKTGFWDTVKFYPDSYNVVCDRVYSGYDYQEYSPFYALGDDYKVATFDVPVTRLSNRVNGLQILGWGGHFPFVPRGSQPAHLLDHLNKQYGENPVIYNDDGKWWNSKYVAWIQEAIKKSVATRATICRDLLQQQPWDLFITVFGDTHSAGHDLYDQSQPDHPLHSLRSQNGSGTDPLLAAFEEVDQAIGKILEAAPEEAYVMCFAVHGMTANYTDLLSLFFIGEILYRFNFPGQAAIAPGTVGTPPPDPITKPLRGGWAAEIWRQSNTNLFQRFLNNFAPKQWLKTDQNGLASPYKLRETGMNMAWAPTMLYSPLWPQMKAFGLPGFADGHVRINLKGRERDGIVAVDEYDALCTELTELFYRLRDGRTGQPLVKQVIRTRQFPLTDDPKLPDGDLIVVWHECPTDVVDSPDLGRIGPVTFNRPGGHRAQGFMMAQGPGIVPGSDVLGGRVIDLAPTILGLLNAPVPNHFDGQPLFKVSTSVGASSS